MEDWLFVKDQLMATSGAEPNRVKAMAMELILNSVNKYILDTTHKEKRVAGFVG